MRIVSLMAHVPYPGIPHAGGQYVLSHLRGLRALGHEVQVGAVTTLGDQQAEVLRRTGHAVRGVLRSERPQ